MTDKTNVQWSADHIRLSLFSSEAWSAETKSIFHQAFSIDPEAITDKPLTRESSGVGTWNGFRLTVEKSLTRVDFIVQEAPTGSNEPTPLIRDAKSKLPMFSGAVGKWAASQAQSVIRIAVGGHFLLASHSTEDSYKKLNDLIKVINVDVDRFKEFKFQVNLPIPSSAAPDITINRLTTWSAVSLRAVLVGFDTPQFVDGQHFVSSFLDINTNGDRNYPFSRDLIEKVTEELTANCLSILDEGIS